MKRLMIVSGSVLVAGLLSSCTTMSKDECLVGAWGEKGYADGAAGYPMSRLDDHAQACAKYQVAPNPSAYGSAREDGLRTYCTFERGWIEGRAGNTYYGVCRPEEEAAFVPAYRDGLRLHEVEAAEGALNRAEARIDNREDKLEAKQNELRGEGLTDEERERIRDRIQEVRGEIRDARRDAREARDALDRAEWDLFRVRRELSGRYPVF